MARFLCVNEGTCFEPSNPLRGISSEGEDAPTFIALFQGNFFLPQPPLGSNFRQTSVGGSATSTASQSDANLAAHNAALNAMARSWGTPPSQRDQLPNAYQSPSGLDGVPAQSGPFVPPLPDADPLPPQKPVIAYNTAQSVTVYCPDGLPFTVLVPPGLVNGLTQEEADQAARSYVEQTVLNQRFCLSDLSQSAFAVNVAFAVMVTVSGGAAPFTFTSDDLPSGLMLVADGDRSTWITGAPTVVGLQTFHVRATDSSGNFMEKSYSIQVV